MRSGERSAYLTPAPPPLLSAASIAATSIFRMVIIASKARFMSLHPPQALSSQAHRRKP
jgi:hypothetical protein